MTAEPVETDDRELVHHFAQPAAGQIITGSERMQVADHLHRFAHIRGNDVDHRLIDFAGMGKSHQRNIEPLFVY